ncbi:MAG: MFS transporter [Chloroflexi bacterium]|nr:MFS transporter [Chloroflexota bacterium]
MTQFALITFFYGLPGVLITPFAGVLVDRWDRRKTLILSDLGAAVSTFGILLLVTTDQLQIWHIYVAVALISIFGAIQEPASQATVPLLVPKERLGRANGMMQIGPSLSRIVAPFLAGTLLVTIGLKGITQIDLATFLFAVIVLFAIRIPNPTRTQLQESNVPKESKRDVFIADVKLGWHYIRDRAGLYGLFLLAIVINFTQGMVVIIIAPIVLSFAGAETLGWVFAISGVGALLGALVMSVWGGTKRKMDGFFVFGFLRAILLLLGGLQPNAWLIAIASAFYLFCSQIASASLITIWQVKVPKELQGRVFSTVRLAGAFFFPVGQILAGPLSDYVFQPMLETDGILANSVGQIIGVGAGRGIGFLLIVVGLFNLIVMFIAYFNPRTRLIEDEIPDAIQDNEEETMSVNEYNAATVPEPSANEDQSSEVARKERKMKSVTKWGLRVVLLIVILLILFRWVCVYFYASRLAPNGRNIGGFWPV